MPNNIKALRKKAGLTQQELCDALGIKINRLRGWEQGKRNPTGKMGIVLANFFGVSVDTVFGSEFADESALQPDEMDLLEVFRSLNADGRRMVYANAIALAKSGDYNG